MSNRAKATFKFAREQLSQLGKLLGFQNIHQLYLAAAPDMLTLARCATFVEHTHDMHASSEHVQAEAQAVNSHLTVVRSAGNMLCSPVHYTMLISNTDLVTKSTSG